MAQPGQRKVLIAIDGSSSAEEAFNWYLNNLRQPNDYVYCLTIPEYSLAGITVGPLANTDNLIKQFGEKQKKVEKLCSDYTAKLREKGVAGQMDPVPGDKPAVVILEQADALKADIIVMGTRGLGTLKRLMMGSVSNFVVLNSHIPVCVIPSKQ